MWRVGSCDAQRDGGDGEGERLGIFGGTFDPPHVGHLVTAVNVRHELALDRVLLVVSNLPWQKVGTRDDLAGRRPPRPWWRRRCADVEGLEASPIELDAGGPSYTADTLAALLAEDPARELFVILGADAAAGLLTWERCEEVRDRPPSSWSSARARPGRRAPRVAVDPGGGAAPRGVEHGPAGPGRRRSPARLPRHP